MIKKVFVYFFVSLFVTCCSTNKKTIRNYPDINTFENRILYRGFQNVFKIECEKCDSVYVSLNEIPTINTGNNIFYLNIPQNYKNEKYRLEVSQFRRRKLLRKDSIPISLRNMNSYISLGIKPNFKIYDSIPINLFIYINGLLGIVEAYNEHYCAVKNYNISILRDNCLVYNSEMNSVLFDQSFKDFIQYMQKGDVIIFSNACMECWNLHEYCEMPPLVYYLK